MRAFLLGLIAAWLACAAPAMAGPRVRVETGIVEGVALPGDVRAFLGVPYAAPPLRDLRWRAPAPPVRWSGVRDATQHGPSCMQADMSQGTGPWTPEFFPPVGSSEDCLTVSVWTPSARRGAHLPVMLWIPGGGFRNGGHAVPVNDGAALAREGMVVVSINYRVGAFGFLAHPDLAVEGVSGNYGLRDAIAALRWVRANARAFGGDPERITIAGQSAGGGLVTLMLTTPETRGLFAGAIVQSSPPGGRTFADRAAAEQNGATFAERLGAATLTDMRAAPADAVLRVSDAMSFGPFVDGALVPESPNAAFARGNFANVPMLVGFTANERSTPVDLARHGSASAEQRRLYPAETDAEANEAAYAYERDRTFLGLERWLNAIRRPVSGAVEPNPPVFVYLWTHAAPGPDATRFRAFHSSEMPYMFGTFDPFRPYTDSDRAISDVMLDYWSNFVKAGNPNGEALTTWPRADEGPFRVMELGDRWGVAAGVAPAKYDHQMRTLTTDGAFVF